MSDFWEGFDFPTLDPVETVNTNSAGAISSTPGIDEIDTILVKRAMVVFFVIDISGSMKGARIGAVNDAIRNLLPELKKREASNTNAEIRIAILEFSSSANWRTLTPQPVSTFVYDDITYVSGGTNFGAAFNALNEKLSRKSFLNAAAGAYTPLIILLTDGKPSDIALYPEQLEKLRRNSWFQYAAKAGIAIEEGALSPECKKVLMQFTGSEKMVLEAKDTNVLSKQIELVTLTGVNFVTQQGSLQNAGNNMGTGTNAAGNAAPLQAANRVSAQNPVSAPNPVSTPNPVSVPNEVSASNPVPAPSPASVSNPVPAPVSVSNQTPASVDVTAGTDPVIPGLSEIDWENDFPTFG
ncbi:MAG: VWA domain-containing protein [Lachnospiraceae bacterium]|nr:VWA domain-containing protein [Lachnospiraceae bacterium]